MYGFIDNVDFVNLEAEKYWSFPSGYKGDSKTEAKNMIFSGDYLGSRKMDGHYFRFIKDEDGNMILQSRTKSVNGTYLNKIDWVPQLHAFFNELPNGTCLLGELYFPNNEGSKKVTTVMGCLVDKARVRQEKGEKLHYYIFDVWAFNNESLLKLMIEDRIFILDSLHNDSYSKYTPESIDCLDFAFYYKGEKLWEELQTILYEGGEGIVITKSGSTPEPGKRTARKTLKIKKEIEHEIDCFLTGAYKPATRLYSGKEIKTWSFWENVKTNEKFNLPLYNEYCEGRTIEPITKGYFYDWAGAVEIGVVDDNNNIIPIGWISGVSDEIKCSIVEEDSSLIKKVVKVTAMEIDDESGSLRHAKIVEWRDDKDWKDCSIKQLK